MALAQAINNLLPLPLLTRLYTPSTVRSALIKHFCFT
jgi:hypothetical protein